MSERTAMVLASLSHGMFWMIWPLPILFGVAIFGAGRLEARARTDANVQALTKILALRRVSRGLFAASVVLFGIAFCHIGCAALVGHSHECMANSKQLALGVLMYAEDYDEHLPAPTRWEESIASRVKGATRPEGTASSDPFQCPAAYSPASYGMNEALGHLRQSNIEAPAETVMLVDADAPRHSFAGGPRDLARERHSGAPNVVFADGHVKYENIYVVDKLNWLPKADR